MHVVGKPRQRVIGGDVGDDGAERCDGAFELLDAARGFLAAAPAAERERFRFLHVSTDEVYGSLGVTGAFSETTPYAPNSPYAASKAAVVAFTKAVAVEYRDDGIRCNAILPSVIDTPANRAATPKADHDRWVKPADIATVIGHLLSDDASPTSGAAIPVYGRA